MNTNQSFHWVAVGKLSDAAEREVTRTGGQVVYCAAEPPVTLVGIAYERAAHPDDLAFNHGSEIQIDVHSTGLGLVWLSHDRLINAAYMSLTSTELITFQEYEARLMDAADVPSYTGIDDAPPHHIDALEDLDDYPF